MAFAFKKIEKIFRDSKIQMNILFVTENEISPIQGGTERITHTLSREFMALGHQCSLLYYIPAAKDLTVSYFSAKLALDLSGNIDSQISSFLNENRIEVVIVNFVRYSSKKQILPILYKEASSLGAKVIVCFHAMPGEDMIGTSLLNVFYRLIHRYDQKQALKDLTNAALPKSVSNLLFGKRIREKYRLSIDNCDRFVLLSEEFYKRYCELAGTDDIAKFRAVPNALSFADVIHEDKLEEKQNRVLIVARMHERSKRLSMAFKIWKLVEKDPSLNNWHLDIVGGGPDSLYFRKLVRFNGLKRCHLLGRQPEIDEFYENSSIFMMTSAFEGFGITLIEAQQNGVVPIAFNSYASLKDIIVTGENGVIVPNNDVDAFYHALKSLMLDEEKRLQMAKSGLKSCLAFSQKEITAKWIKIIDELINNK